MASQITDASIHCSTICSGADQRKYQSCASLVLGGESTGDRWIPLTESNAQNIADVIMWNGFIISHDTACFPDAVNVNVWRILLESWSKIIHAYGHQQMGMLQMTLRDAFFLRDIHFYCREIQTRTQILFSKTHPWLSPCKGMNTTWCMNRFIIYSKEKQKNMWNRNRFFKVQENGKRKTFVKKKQFKSERNLVISIISHYNKHRCKLSKVPCWNKNNFKLSLKPVIEQLKSIMLQIWFEILTHLNLTVLCMADLPLFGTCNQAACRVQYPWIS